MKIGINLLNFGPGATPENFSESARAAEALGYHFVGVSDHVALTPDVSSQYPAPFYDPFTLLAWLSGITQKVELATTVAIVPYRSPLLLARIGANIDRLSGGRFILGVGVGWARQEFEALGVPFEKRGAITNSYLEAILELWTKDEVSREGNFVKFERVQTGPRPLASPHPPIWVGGSSDAAMKRAVLFGDAWHPIRVRISWLEKKAAELSSIAKSLGRRMPQLCPRILLRPTEEPAGQDRRAGEGTLEQIHGDFEALDKLGCPYVLLDFFTGDVEATRRLEPTWRIMTTLADRIFDLPR
ncbi:MAG: TIGR03619 family F420-dependent LLM class oxidoreductase, partial [Vicinamibacteria bacterium]